MTAVGFEPTPLWTGALERHELLCSGISNVWSHNAKWEIASCGREWRTCLPGDVALAKAADVIDTCLPGTMA
jgi:hypothetical protein